MIHVICGLIGAGKSTYAKSHYEYVTEFEDTRSKDKQIAETIRLHKEGKTVAHITCYPTRMEQISFYQYEPKMIWIDTDYMQAMTNILNRGRQRDIAEYSRIERDNLDLFNKRGHGPFNWEFVNVF